MESKLLELDSKPSLNGNVNHKRPSLTIFRLLAEALVAIVVMNMAISPCLVFADFTSIAVSDEWKTTSPEEVGIDSDSLAEMFRFVRERNIPVHSIQIVRHGRLVLDAYFYPYQAGMRHDVASVTKSITSTLVGIAIDKGLIRNVHAQVLSFFESRSIASLDARKQTITLEHLLTMQAGWDCGFELHEARLFEMRRTEDWPKFMLDLPMVAEPGSRWAYCSGNCHLLSAILTQTTHTNALTFARRELFGPLGIEDVAWAADSQGNNHGWGDLQLRPRDMAKIGQLFLQQGQWHDRRIVSETWIHDATRAHADQTINRDHYGYFWWVKGNDYPGMFEAVGRGGQRINVWPAKDLVIVFTGGEFEPGDITPFILKALKSDKPLVSDLAASERLKQGIVAATNPPPPKAIDKLPSMAARISGKRITLSANGLDLSGLRFLFSQSEGKVQLTRLGEQLNSAIGLDDVERFSANTFIGLPFAAKGKWLSDDTFFLQINRVGGINCYDFTLKFLPDARAVTVSLKEHTGLNNETFTGTVAE
ncbi:MAG: 6-aminohexanoate-dimer hydrolase [Verrucomicrobiales bacterium]|nr:6-aminohexanoate-dimer hydrolase [Verrucomicrobiales bacterium]